MGEREPVRMAPRCLDDELLPPVSMPKSRGFASTSANEEMRDRVVRALRRGVELSTMDLCGRCGASERQMQRALTSLQENGVIVSRRVKGLVGSVWRLR